mgnify:FL=1
MGDSIPNKFTHVIFYLKSQKSNLKSTSKKLNFETRNGSDAVLYYNDRRRFGWIRVVPTEKVSEMPFFKNLGPEPFKDLTLDLFAKILSRSATAIKPLIMDQKRIGGIGNIYANDALNLAKIAPTRPGKSLSLPEVKKLYNAVLEVMKLGFKYGGSSEVDFVNALGQKGSYQDHSRVYGRKGEKCPNCGGIIKKTFLGGRGTYFCENCQK